MERRVVAAQRQRYDDAIDLYLSDCFAKRTTARADELSSLLGGAREHVGRTVQQLFGRSLAIIMRDKQLEEVKRLLTAVAPLSMDDIAAASGFGTRSTLFRRFKSAFGCTPHEYRSEFSLARGDVQPPDAEVCDVVGPSFPRPG